MKKFLLYSGLILGILLLAALGTSFWLVQSTAARVAAQREAIKAAGDHLYLTDYEVEEIPDEENAYHYLILARGDLEAFDEDYSAADWLALERRLRPEQVDELAALIEKYPEMFENLERAAVCEEYQQEVDYAQGITIMLPHIQLFRGAARALSARALVKAYRGDGDAALRQSEMSLRVSSHLRSEPLLIGHLVNMACQAIAVQTANHSLRVADTSPEARASLDELLDSLDNRQATVDAMKGERAMGVQTFQQLRNGTLDPQGLGDPALGPISAVSSTWLGQAYLNDDEAKYIELLDAQIEAVQLDRDEREQAMQPVIDELQQGGFRHVLTRLLVPALNSVAEAADRREAENRCLRVLLAIEEEVDVTIEDVALPAAARIDPFTGEPLLLLHKEVGPVVYSVGENGLDDRGSVHAPPGGGQSLDIGLGPLLDALKVDDLESEDL